MTSTVAAPDDRSLSCRVTARARSGRYRIVTDYVTDTARESVVMRSRFTALKGRTRDYRVYVRFDPTLNGNGGGGTGNGGKDSGAVATAGGHTLLVGSDPVTATNAANRDYAVPVNSALDADKAFLEVSNGFAGKPSDGLEQLDADRRLSSHFAEAAGRRPRPDRARRPAERRRVRARPRPGRDPGRRRHHGAPEPESELPRPQPLLRPELEPLRRQAHRTAPAARRLGAPLARARSTSTT